MTIRELNALDRAGFVAALGWVFEDSPWVAERTWSTGPFENMEALHAAMVSQLVLAKSEEQLALLRAHPDLGTRAKVSDASRAEQEGAGLDRLTEEEFIRLNDQNAAYRERFGFPFLLAVKGITKQEVLRALEERGRASRDAEFAEALRQAYRIARFRLEAAVS